MTNPSPRVDVPPSPQKQQGFPVHLRCCYYLRLGEAERTNRPGNDGCIFRVPAALCWVVVPQDYGCDWFAILPLLSPELVAGEREKGLQATLGRVSSAFDDSTSWVLDIPERYPATLLRSAEHQSGRKGRIGQLQLIAPAHVDPQSSYSSAQLRYCY